MATSTTITGMTDLGAAPAATDVTVLVDVSDTTQSANGTTKKATFAEVFTTPNITTSLTVTGASATALAVGRLGATTPAFTVDASTASQVAGMKVTGAATGGTVAVIVTDSGSNANLTIDAKGSGTLGIQTVGTGNVTVGAPTNVSGSGGLAIGDITGRRRLASTSSTAFQLLSDGNAFADLSIAALTATGAITTSSASGGIGYATGAGGTVTQQTNRTTGVTLNAVTGAITTANNILAPSSQATFTVTNSTVAATDTVLLTVRSGQALPLTTWLFVTAVAAGSFNITVANTHAASNETGAIVINFSVVKAVTS